MAFSTQTVSDFTFTATPADIWTAAVSSDWFDPGNWSIEVPTATDAVVIGGGEANITLTGLSQTGVAVAGSLTLAAGAQLDLEGGTLSVSDRTSNTGGEITIEAVPAPSSSISSSVVNFAGAVTNTGTIAVTGFGAPFEDTAIATFDSSVDNSGSITVFASSAGNNSANVTFEGAVVNTGQITVGGTATKTIQTTATFESSVNNSGTIEADQAGKITLEDGGNGATLTNQTGGTIDANGGSIVLDTGNTITNHGLLEATNSGTLDVQDGKIDNDGAGAAGLVIDTNSTFLVDAGNPNTGNVTLQLTGSGDVTLAGGTITENVDNPLVTGSGAILVLDNVDNTISGAGTIGSGDGHFALSNEFGGTVDADVANASIDLNTGNTIENSGTLEATNLGILNIEDNVDNSGGGTIQVNGGLVDLANANSAADAVTFTTAGGTLELDAADSYTGTIGGFGAGDFVDTNNQYGLSTPPAITYAVWDNANTALQIFNIDGLGDGVSGPSDTLTFAGSFGQESFALRDDGFGNTEIIAAPTTVSVTGVDGGGNPTDGSAITISLDNLAIDPNSITYTWIDNNVIQSDTSDSFTPTSVGDRVIGLATFTDPNDSATDTVTAVAGTVQTAPAIPVPPSTNLVANGGFELNFIDGTGATQFDNWVLANATGNLSTSNGPAHSGTYDAGIGSLDPQEPVTLSQDISTTQGAQYEVSFWLTNGDGANDNQFSVTWGGQTILQLSDAPQSSGYTNYVFDVVGDSRSIRPAIYGVQPDRLLAYRRRLGRAGQRYIADCAAIGRRYADSYDGCGFRDHRHQPHGDRRRQRRNLLRHRGR